MNDSDDLLHRRFGLTPQPVAGASPGDHAEAKAQWFLELSFFRDCLSRKQPSKGGKGELADGAILAGDVLLMVQVKHQESPREPEKWAPKAIRRALKQLGHTNRMLGSGHVKTIASPTLGEIPFDAANYPNRAGLIILDQPGSPFDPVAVVPELSGTDFPVHVFSLTDLQHLCRRLDTAGDFVVYLDIREWLATTATHLVNDEARTTAMILEHARTWLQRGRPMTTEDVLDKSVESMRATLAGGYLTAPSSGYGRAIDDIIARLHDLDPELPYNNGVTGMQILRVIGEFAWLTRAKRAAAGKRLLEICAEATDGRSHHFDHVMPSRGVVFVYLATGLSRIDRLEYLTGLVLEAKQKHNCRVGIGVATEPMGPGRSYDTVFHED